MKKMTTTVFQRLRHGLFLTAVLWSVCPFNSHAEVSPAVQDLQRAILMVDATMERSFTNGNNFRMYDTYDTSTQQGSGTADVWPYTAALEAHCSVLEALDALKDEAPQLYQDNHDRFVTRLKQLYNALDYYRGTYTLNSYAQIKNWSIYGVHRGGSKGTAAVTGIENVYDDQMWICRELVRAYKLTGDNDYLSKAEYLANYCIDGWDCCLDANGNEYGGISWGPGYNSKHSCSNGPLIQPLVWLYEIYKTDDEEANLRFFYILQDGTRTNDMRRHSDVYLEFARKIYAWQKEKLLDKSRGVYWDMLGAPGEIQYVGEGRNKYRTHVDTGGPTGTAYTYNSGTMLAGTAELWRVTGENNYLADVNSLSQACWSQFANGRRVNGNVFFIWPTDDVATSGFNTWFDDVLMRAYADAAPYNTTVYNGKTHAENALLSFEQNLNYAFENHNRYNMLPIHLIDGWGDSGVTKGFHQLAFASEYAVIALWRASTEKAAQNIGTTKSSNVKPQSSKTYNLLGQATSAHPTTSKQILIQDNKKFVAQ